MDNTFPKVEVKTTLTQSDNINNMIDSFSYTIDNIDNGGILSVEMLPYSIYPPPKKY